MSESQNEAGVTGAQEAAGASSPTGQAQQAHPANSPAVQPPPAAQEDTWERKVLEKLATAALKEQRRTRIHCP